MLPKYPYSSPYSTGSIHFFVRYPTRSLLEKRSYISFTEIIKIICLSENAQPLFLPWLCSREQLLQFQRKLAGLYIWIDCSVEQLLSIAFSVDTVCSSGILPNQGLVELHLAKCSVSWFPPMCPRLDLLSTYHVCCKCAVVGTRCARRQDSILHKTNGEGQTAKRRPKNTNIFGRDTFTPESRNGS